MRCNVGSSYKYIHMIIHFDKSVFKTTAFFQVDHSESGSMTDVQGALVTSQPTEPNNNGTSDEVQQTMCQKCFNHKPVTLKI